MKTPSKPIRFKPRGFSLAEIVCAMGLIVGSAVPLVGLLAHGMTQAQSAANSRTVASLRTSVRQLLRNPEWPIAASAGNWDAQCWFDSAGLLMSENKREDASVEARLSASPGLGFSSERLETVTVTFHAVPAGAELGRCIVQRAR